MNIPGMKEAGQKSKSLTWSNEELDSQIYSLELVIAYFEGRGDANIILLPLRMDLETFNRMKWHRKD